MDIHWVKVLVLLFSAIVACTTASEDDKQKVDFSNPELQQFIASLSDSDKDLVMRYPSKAGLLLDALHHKGGEGDTIEAPKRQIVAEENDSWNNDNVEELLAKLDAVKVLLKAPAHHGQHHHKSAHGEESAGTEMSLEELLQKLNDN